MNRYNPKEIEPKWQKIWDDRQIYKANLNSSKHKYIAMSMFNYPSGAGIHIGHAMNYTISDVMARYKRQQGYESYHPVGWDAFGLPAENYAIKTGISPQESMKQIIPSYHKQYKAMGWSNDWSKEIATHEPAYYKWTQWIFSQMYKNGLAYQEARMQWWCTKCQTVLANEQVVDGKCWRHDGADDPIIEKKEVKQWFFKITDYADELLEATDALDWSEVVKTAQKNWIGKSKGAEIDFKLADGNDKITVFTTRPDTIFGATFLVLAPEHELVEQLTTKEQKAKVDDYTKQSTKKTEVERQASKEKTGVFTGSYAINPASNDKIPIWVADYVLVGYGTGAIMAVPAHDERDNEFAKKYDLPICEVISRVFGTPVSDAVTADGANIIGYSPSTKRFLSLHNNIAGLDWIPGGGRNNEESYEQTAIRELNEEAGYSRVSQIIQLGGMFHANYFNANKQSNRRATGYNFLAIIDESEDISQKSEEHEDFSVQWTDFDTLRNSIEKQHTDANHWLYALDQARLAVDALEKNQEYSPMLLTDEGVMINSGKYDGLSSAETREKIVADLEKQGLAKEKTTFKIRDWSVSRQRYWGAPIPIINCKKCGQVLVSDEDLPIVLPELDDYAPSGDGRSALARATDWLEVDCPKCGGKGERETDTLDTYICSSWYYLRYFDPTNKTKAFDSSVVNKWMPIDFYNGGDHATAHMIYARFITRFFHKIGLLDNPEPFKKFLFNGKIMASDGQMFSKSKGNGVDPLEIIEQGYGADALRTYLMFAAPLDLWIRWDPQGVPGAYRFLNRVWNIVQEFVEAKESDDHNDQALKIIHPAIKKVTEDLEEQKYNTAIATMMKATNELYELKSKQEIKNNNDWRTALESLVMLIAPFAPHTADELWSQLGHKDSVNVDNWPEWNDKFINQDVVTIVVQVNGKLRGQVQMDKGSSEDEVILLAQSDSSISRYISGGIKKVIYVPNRLINFVV